MTQLDWIIVAFAVLLAVFGYRQGFIVVAFSFAGFLAGAYLGVRLAPLVLSQGDSSPYAPAFGLVGGIFGGAVLASALEWFGHRVRSSLVLPGMGLVDGVLGAFLGVVLALGVAWVLAAVAVQLGSVPSLRSAVQRSAILRHLNSVLPPSGAVLNDLARLDPLPSLSGPLPAVAAPDGRAATSPAAQRASDSVVRIVGTACGVGIEGSGWVAARETVVTNAHVVAGEEDTTVQVPGHPFGLTARAIAFDPKNDIAVLRVPGLELPVLTLASPYPSGTGGAIVGYPEDGGLTLDPARIGRTQVVQTDNAYGNGPVERLITPVRGLVRPGNSGGPVVDEAGQVLTTIFARALGAGPPAGYGVANETVAQGGRRRTFAR